MLYYIFRFFDHLNLPGAGMFKYISFRSGLAIITSLLINTLFGKYIINFLQRKQIGEVVRDLNLEGQYAKKGTPTMGGVVIIASILIPTLLFCDLTNVYVILMIVSTLWLGTIGFIDDYIKVFKKNKEGLAGRYKIVGQVGLGLIVSLTLLFNNSVVVREKVPAQTVTAQTSTGINIYKSVTRDVKSTQTTVPFIKNNRFDYKWFVSFMGDKAADFGWLVFMIVVIFIITAVSNGANMTDGLDGLATGTSAIIGSTLGILAYLASSAIWADYLHILFIPNAGELVIFMSAFIGATVGFLWFNSFPAQIFMGDTGSLTLGGIIAVFAIIIRMELLIPILCGIFFVENLSVMIQVFWFKHTKKKYGEGQRVFLMAPLHHHYQKKGYPESKIVTRFWIVGIILAVLTFVTLKVR